MSNWINPTKNSASMTNQSKNSVSISDTTKSIVEFYLLIDNTFQFLIDGTYKFIIEIETLSWSNIVKS